MKQSICAAIVLVSLGALVPAWGQCPPSCAIPGGGEAAEDCHAEFAATALRLNYPPFDPAAPQPRTEVRCFDGDAGCDTDGTVDNACVFDIDVCLRNADPALAECTPADVTAVTVEADGDPDLTALQTALGALLPATTNVCTADQQLRVPLEGPNADGTYTRGTKTVRLQARTGETGSDDDQLILTCVPRGWPSHGYNHANHRSNPNETILSAENAAQLTIKWHLDFAAIEGTQSNGVAGTPTAGNGLLYIPARRKTYAVDPETGEIRWAFEPGGGVTSSPTLTADGRVLISDSSATVYCLDAVTGKLLWQKSYALQAPDHMWASPTVANNRVFIGIASHSDIPCTQGHLVAADLDTGDLLWDLKTVPDRICDNDTGMECENNTDCGGGTCTDTVCDNDTNITCDEDADCGGTCIPGRGAGVTATVAVDPTGETVYMNTVGCYTYPSIGDSDSMFRIEAATGRVVWKNRVQPPEQFGACDEDRSIDCGTDDDCEVGSCETKAAYHDFGFLNGPLILPIEAGAGGTRPLVVSGSKDGTLYAFNPDDGEIVWTNEVVPTPVTPGFAGFGLFNGAIAYARERIYAALFVVVPASRPEPEHLMAFSTTDGTSLWSDDIGRSWSHVTSANDLLFAGTEILAGQCARARTACTEDNECDGEPCVMRGPFYVYDARDGTRLKGFVLPGNVVGGATILDGNVYVPYFGTGGLVALGLSQCPGDCNRDGSVRVDELVRGVNIALDVSAVDTCHAIDGNADWLVGINELVGAVNSLINGCGEEPA